MKLLYDTSEGYFYAFSTDLSKDVINKYGAQFTYLEAEKILSSDISRNQEIINIFEDYIKNNESEYLDRWSNMKIVEITEGKYFKIFVSITYDDTGDELHTEEIFISDSPIEKINLEEL